MKYRTKRNLIILAVVVVAGLGYGGYYYWTEIKPYSDLKAKYGSLPNFNILVSQLKQEKASINNSPNSDGLYIDLGNVYYNLGDYGDALTSYQKASKLNPGNYLPYYWMARLSVQKEDYESAQNFYLKAISVNPKAEFPYVDLSRLYRFDIPKVRDSGGIVQLLQKGLETNPGNETLLRTLLDEYARQNDITGQIDTIKKILVVNPNDNLLKDSLGQLEASRK